MAETPSISATASATASTKDEEAVRTVKIVRAVTPILYGGNMSAQTIRDSIEKGVGDPVKSNQSESAGVEIQHPFDFQAVKQFKNANTHHSTCIETKVAATTGIGFHDSKKKVIDEQDGSVRWVKQVSKVGKVTQDITDQPFLNILSTICEDYWQVGTGYLEVVRDGPGGRIVGLHHLDAIRVKPFLEEDQINIHYVISAQGNGADSIFAAFGDSEDLSKRLPGQVSAGAVSEVICFLQPSSQTKYYGMPDWLSAVQPIELVQCMLQYKFDFFFNRGVPEYLLFIIGQKLEDKEWEAIEESMKANMGLTNSHKSMALNISNPEVKVQVEKLALDNKLEDEINAASDPLALMIVTAHRVPPLLAGIQIPGKLGATNELPNALVAFQKLVIDEAQGTFMEVLGRTLGAEGVGIEGLGMDDFAFSSILDEFDLQSMDTMSRMREPVTGANRDLSEGVRD